jgi:hypothetical protein
MLSKKRVTAVEEVQYGVYLWQMPDGGLVCDEDRNYLSISAMKGDIKKIQILKNVAKHYGLENGRPVWFSGHRKISDEEYETQKQRLEWGLIPDELDVPAIKEDLEQKKKMGLV